MKMKRKQIDKILGQLYDLALYFDHTLTLTLKFQDQSLKIAFSQKWDCQLTWNDRDVSHPFMTMILTFVLP